MVSFPGQLLRFTTVHWAINHYSFCPPLLKLFMSVRDGDSNSCYFCLMLECSYTHTLTSLHYHCAYSLLPPRLIFLHLCSSHVCYCPLQKFLNPSTLTSGWFPVSICLCTHLICQNQWRKAKGEWKYSKEAINWILFFLIFFQGWWQQRAQSLASWRKRRRKKRRAVRRRKRSLVLKNKVNMDIIFLFYLDHVHTYQDLL